jgi:hypothetical protein
MEELSMSDALPSHLEKARENILSWLGSDIPDEEKCDNLLREMEVVNEDGHFAYDAMEDDSVEGFRSIVNQKISYGCEQESQDLI